MKPGFVPIQFSFDDLGRPDTPTVCPRCGAVNWAYGKAFNVEGEWTGYCQRGCGTVRISDGAKLGSSAPGLPLVWIPKEATDDHR